MLPFCISLSALILAVVLLLKRAFQIRIHHSKLPAIHDLLNPPSTHLSTLLRARAEPNLRLVRAFDLHNTFVSPDPDIHKRFAARAVHLLRRHTQSFTGFPDATRDIASESLSHMLAGGQPVPYDTFIQVTTLRVITVTLLEGEIPVHDTDAVIFVAKAINELWVLSKTCGSMPPGRLDAMNTHLRTWLPQYEHPLDFIVPTYETMWRVVAIAVARAHADDASLHAFCEYIDDPVDAQFQLFAYDRPSVEAFLNEVLRLHPPSKHISRASASSLEFPLSLFSALPWLPASIRQKFTPVDVADIQAIHRDEEVWGGTASAFDPMRFHPSRVTREQKLALLPFGYGPLRCVAYKEAPRIAAVVVGVILEALAGTASPYTLTCGAEVGGRDGWDDWAIEKRTE
ncbi:hypothetical protein BV25DRAFT_699492 [Artomyces pyxidatus]|uniref:Uncharacterized protein n=1 Tax=Artomyces pyxidatus TaxID=48021 RepID=A0ACB8T074_9AGAM|nr:hypothetical protein BV25DRAFT_699492 [Artomyces pyxidatus]